MQEYNWMKCEAQNWTNGPCNISVLFIIIEGKLDHRTWYSIVQNHIHANSRIIGDFYALGFLSSRSIILYHPIYAFYDIYFVTLLRNYRN